MYTHSQAHAHTIYVYKLITKFNTLLDLYSFDDETGLNRLISWLTVNTSLHLHKYVFTYVEF